MTDYTHKSLGDVEDMAPQFGMPPEMQARFAREALGLRAPRRVMIVDALPSTSNGKVDVRLLQELATARR